MLEFLHQKGVDLSAGLDGTSIAIEVTRYSDVSCLDVLHGLGVDLNRTTNGLTPAKYAARAEVQCVKYVYLLMTTGWLDKNLLPLLRSGPCSQPQAAWHGDDISSHARIFLEGLISHEKRRGAGWQFLRATIHAVKLMLSIENTCKARGLSKAESSYIFKMSTDENTVTIKNIVRTIIESYHQQVNDESVILAGAMSLCFGTPEKKGTLKDFVQGTEREKDREELRLFHRGMFANEHGQAMTSEARQQASGQLARLFASAKSQSKQDHAHACTQKSRGV